MLRRAFLSACRKIGSPSIHILRRASDRCVSSPSVGNLASLRSANGSAQPALPTESSNSGPRHSQGPHDRLEPELLLSGIVGGWVQQPGGLGYKLHSNSPSAPRFPYAPSDPGWPTIAMPEGGDVKAPHDTFMVPMCWTWGTSAKPGRRKTAPHPCVYVCSLRRLPAELTVGHRYVPRSRVGSGSHVYHISRRSIYE